jgi:hypothetical protein
MADSTKLTQQTTNLLNLRSAENINAGFGYEFSHCPKIQIRVKRLDGNQITQAEEDMLPLDSLRENPKIVNSLRGLKEFDVPVVYGSRKVIQNDGMKFSHDVLHVLTVFSRNAVSSGFFCVGGAFLTNRRWLNLFEPSNLGLLKLETLRVLNEEDCNRLKKNVEYRDKPWQHLDSMLAKDPKSSWSSKLSLSQARNVIEDHKEEILGHEFGAAVAAFVQHVDCESDSRLTQTSSSRSIETFQADLGVSRARFILEVQRNLDSVVGASGKRLVRIVKELAMALESYGLIMCRVEEAESRINLETDGNKVWVEDLSTKEGAQKQFLASFPKVTVVPIEQLNDQAILNDVASKKIRLLSINQVSKFKAEEFFEYFDRVHEHVDRKELAKQMQCWLNAFPENQRGFDDDVTKKRNFARALNSRVKLIGYRFRCGLNECGAPSGLIASISGNSKVGQFFFSHEKSASHARSANLPKLILMPTVR